MSNGCCCNATQNEKTGDMPSVSRSCSGSEARKPIKRVLLLSKDILPAIGIALFPKCPMCWAAYMSILGAVGFNSIPFQPWIPYALMGMVAINMAFLLYSGLRGLGYIPFMLGLLGASSVAVSKFFLSYEPGIFVGVGLIFISSMVSSLRPVLRKQKQMSDSILISTAG